MSKLQENAQEALKWANAIRTEWGLKPLEELPAGTLNHQYNCVLGRALNKRVAFRADGTVVIDLELVKLPEPVATFEYDFERGHYPELTAGGERGVIANLDQMPTGV